VVKTFGFRSDGWIEAHNGYRIGLTLGATGTNAIGNGFLGGLVVTIQSNASVARTNLGLGSASTASSGDFLLVASNLSDLANVATARTNLGLGSMATEDAGDFLLAANNLSDLDDASTARTSLGLGTAAVKDTGTSGDTVPLCNAAANLFSGDLAGNYKRAYSDALNTNAANYANVLKGYQQTMASQQQEQAKVASGYTQLAGAVKTGYQNLSNQVLGRIAGTNASNLQEIADKYSQESGLASQQLVNRGLGNTTVQQSVQRGLALDNRKAVTDSQNKFAQLQANYQSDLGSRGLAAEQNIETAQQYISPQISGYFR
jgi:hypothetical protein